jgi:hypothetical protein
MSTVAVDFAGALVALSCALMWFLPKRCAPYNKFQRVGRNSEAYSAVLNGEAGGATTHWHMGITQNRRAIQ